MTGFKLVLHGTYEKPDYLKNGPRNYNEEEVTVGDATADESKPVKQEAMSEAEMSGAEAIKSQKKDLSSSVEEDEEEEEDQQDGGEEKEESEEQEAGESESNESGDDAAEEISVEEDEVDSSSPEAMERLLNKMMNARRYY